MKKIDIHIHPKPASDPDLDEYVQIMDQFDVSVALVHAAPEQAFTQKGGASEEHASAANDAVLAACRKHPDRLYGSCYIDLRETPQRNIEVIERYSKAGFKCVKMFPNLGFDPNDEIHEPVWETMEELGLACLPHCGYVAYGMDTGGKRLSSLTATPFHFEVPARRHPGIRFIFAHFGGGAAYLETITLCERLENCFADSCPGWGKWVWEHRMPGTEDFPMHKFLYGTDNAGNQYSEDEKWWTDLLLETGRPHEDLENFFHRNAAGILGIGDY